MTRWIVGIGVALIIGAGFFWWRFSTLRDLPPSEARRSTSTAELPPVTVSREDLLKFEQEILAIRAKQLDSVISTSSVKAKQSKTEPQAPPVARAPSSTAVARPSSSFPAPPIQEVIPGVPPLNPSIPFSPTTTATSAMKAPSPPPLKQFLIDGRGFCDYVQGVSAVVISGYPLAADVTIPDMNIKTWTATRVVFLMPDWVPPGRYQVTVRGRDKWGYCTATTSSPAFIQVK